MTNTPTARIIAAAFLVALASTNASAQTTFLDTEALRGVGWHGFLDYRYILESLASLVLATLLGALIAFHPMTPRTVDTLEEAELPKVHVMYALIGAVVGVTVLQYGVVVGLVIFGLGGLMRFRTNTTSTRDTGRLIIVTLIGLISGLNLPHFAVLAAVFAFALIYAFDANQTCRVVIENLPGKRTQEAADVYRATLMSLGCKILSEHKTYSKRRIEFVFRVPRSSNKEKLHEQLGRQVPAELRGEVDWTVE